MLTRDISLIEYANIELDKSSLPFEKKEKKFYNIIAFYEKEFKSQEDNSDEYWEYHNTFKKKIKGLSKKELFELANMWSSVRQGYDVIEILKSSL